MPKETGRTRFHYGFYAAMKVEYDIMHANVTYEQEIQLGEDPIRLDFLIIKKNDDVVLSDPIGKFFRYVNIFEYKSPHDGLSIDDFYKAVGYTLIYKGYDRKVDELPIENITLTIVRHTYPRKLINTLRRSGFVVNEEYPGIFRISGKINFALRLVISSRLPNEQYEGLQLLADGCTRDDVINYAKKAVDSRDENIKANAGTVIDICLDVNRRLASKLKEDSSMNEVIEYIYNKAVSKAMQKGRQEGRQEGINDANKRVAVDMLRKKLPLQLIEDISKLSEDSIRNLAKTLGIAIV